MKNSKKVDKNVFQSLILISQFGINMLVPIGMMVWLGMWLDDRFQTSWITILCFAIGAVAGFQNIFRMSQKFMKSERERRREGSGTNEEILEADKEKE